MKTFAAVPRAALLIESMRDVGYDLDSALADLVDNSLTAGARRIDLLADTTGKSPIMAIIDDGKGMTQAELYAAMRLGSQNPREGRKAQDLGRFGLGLKTASFSQCRRLTVVTRRAGRTSAARWDLDDVARLDDWLVEIVEETNNLPWIDRLSQTGTMILWEKPDRIAGGPDSISIGQEMVRRLDQARAHMELVFHRFLIREGNFLKTNIFMNDRALVPFDPFQTQCSATIAGPVETIRLNRKDIRVQTFTLPHHKKVSTAAWERAAGPGGYTRNQGFYLYRERRLIVHGTWFGLARQTELTKLARVKVDIPNGLDEEWKIDVRKASGQPPEQVRQRFRSIIETIGATSKRIYVARGARLVSETAIPVWHRHQDKNEITYRANEDHPVLAAFVASLSEGGRHDFYRVLELIGSTIPSDAIFADFANCPESLVPSVSADSLHHAVTVTCRRLAGEGMSRATIRDMLELAEPFRSNWTNTQRLLTLDSVWS